MLARKSVAESSAIAIAEAEAASPALTMDVSEQSGRTCVTLIGELDGASAPALQAHLADLTGELAGDLVLDIAGLTFVDSTGLALFVLLHKRLDNTGHELILLHPAPMARRIMQITKLDSLLRIEPPSRIERAASSQI